MSTEPAPGASALLSPAATPPGGTPAPGGDAPAPDPKVNVQFHFGTGIQPPEGTNAVSADAARAEQVVESYRRQGITDENVLKQVRERTPVTEREVQLARYRKENLYKDETWKKSYLAGDREARHTMALLNIIFASPVIREQKS